METLHEARSQGSTAKNQKGQCRKSTGPLPGGPFRLGYYGPLVSFSSWRYDMISSKKCQTPGIHLLLRPFCLAHLDGPHPKWGTCSLCPEQLGTGIPPDCQVMMVAICPVEIDERRNSLWETWLRAIWSIGNPHVCAVQMIYNIYIHTH